MKPFKRTNKTIEKECESESKISVILFSPTLELVRTIVPVLVLIIQLFILIKLYAD